MSSKLYLVHVDQPEGVSDEEMEEYMEVAIGMWKGSLHPDDPLFELDDEEVTCLCLNEKVTCSSVLDALERLFQKLLKVKRENS